jgi:hypothetical protein
VRKERAQEVRRTLERQAHGEATEVTAVPLKRTPAAVRALFGALLAVALIACAGAASARAESGHWRVFARSAPTHLQPGKPGEIVAVIANLGDAPIVATPIDPVVITDALPAGVEQTGPMAGEGETGVNGSSPRLPMSCAGLRCTFVGNIPPLISLELRIPVHATHLGDLGENELHVEGAGAAPQLSKVPLTATEADTPFGVERYELTPEEEDGSPDLQAGSHPFQLTTTVNLNQTFTPDPDYPGGKVELPSAPALLRNVITKLPPGLVANTTVIPQCSDVDFSTIRPGESNTCPLNTAIGAAIVSFKEPFLVTRTETVPVFNLVPAPGEPARFGFEFFQVPVVLDARVATGEGYAAEVTVANASQSAEVLGTILTVWGVPGDSRHDSARGWECLGGGHFLEQLEHKQPCRPLGALNPPPYLLLPTTPCTQPMASSIRAQSWQPGASYLPPVEPAVPETLVGCGKLAFDPTISVAPDRHEASTPSGMTVEINVPQDTTLSAVGLSEADIKDTALTLPEGLTANAGAADGLATCGVGEAGFFGSSTDTGATLEAELAEQHFNREGATCPDASKIGEVSIHSPLLENELKGSVYLGVQNTNPFAPPLVLYIMAEDPVSGVLVKLAGNVMLDQSTGRLTSVFRNAPPLPFSTLKLHLFDGSRASQATPPDCGSYQALAQFTLWKEVAPGQLATATAGEKPGEGFQITSGPHGTPCPAGALPFAPSFTAGATNTQAGAFTPFELNIGHPDGNQQINGLSMHLPQGAAAMLSAVTPCPVAVADAGGCGPASLVGHAVTSSGLGGSPITLGGEAFLTQSLRPGTPFGISVKTPATHVGPFNVGTIIANSTIAVDPNTAAATITAVETRIIESSNPAHPLVLPGLPTMIKGVPVQLQQIHVTVDKPGFEFNPTNCSARSDTGAPMTINDTLRGAEGGSVSQSTPYGVTGCDGLVFTPKLTASVAGHASKANGTTFTVKVESARGQANIAKTFLALPIALPSRLTTIQKACLAATFEANPATCPEGSNIGFAVAHTPVLKKPFVGPAYLVSHGNAAFPDVEFVLQSEGITVVLDGKTDIKHGITFSRFESVPDAPVETFETVLPAGPHSALTANVPESEHFSLCKAGPLLMPTEITGQNGAVIHQTTQIAITGCALSSKTESKLAKALKQCRKRYAHNRRKRASCERAARKKYGARGSKHKKTH